MFEQLTNNIEIFASSERFGTRRGDRVKDGRVISLEMPYVDYSAPVKDFITLIYKFDKTHPQFKMYDHIKTLKRNKIEWCIYDIREADVSKADARLVLALIMGTIRGEIFSAGNLLFCLENGIVTRWLERLREIDQKSKSVK